MDTTRRYCITLLLFFCALSGFAQNVKFNSITNITTLRNAGAVGLGSTLDVAGATTLASSSNSLTALVAGNAGFGGTLTVAGASTLAATTHTSSSNSTTLLASGAVGFGSTLAVAGATTLTTSSNSSTALVAGNVGLGGNFTVAGASTLGTVAAGNTAFTDWPVEIGIAVSDETTALATGAAKVTFRVPFAFTLTAIRASVGTAPVGSTIIVDVNEAGTTVMSTLLTIDAGEKTSQTALVDEVISDSAIADDAEIIVDIDQVGSSTAGAGLKIWLIGTRTI